jgi:RNA polymerase sigma-70 factor (ECF subfamily)
MPEGYFSTAGEDLPQSSQVTSRLRCALPTIQGPAPPADWVETRSKDQGELAMSWDEIFVLIARAQAGDRSAFGELVQRFQPAVYAVALARLRDPNEATELTQEVFIHAMLKIEQLREPHCFVGWLRQITVRMAINRLTRRGPFSSTDQEILQNTAAEEQSPLDDLVRAEQHAELYRGLERLKALDRATLMAFYIHGRSLKQMSREFETPVGTIKRRLHVARNRLRQQLETGPARHERELACV